MVEHDDPRGSSKPRVIQLQRSLRLGRGLPLWAVAGQMTLKGDTRMKTAISRSPVVPANVDEYLADVPEPARSTLNKVRAAIRSAAPPETTEAISYRIPTFKYKGALLAIAAFKNHCSLFPMSYAVMNAFKNELKGFHVSKGTIHFPLDAPMPAALVKKMVKARVAEKDRPPRH
jgi:uncharacterized protein YdhG (YjbR/CyaY superfamily)